MPENRIDPTAAPSPTGTPVLPARFVPILVALGAIAIAVQQFAPAHTTAYKIAAGALAVLALFGLASPGLRR